MLEEITAEASSILELAKDFADDMGPFAAVITLGIGAYALSGIFARRCSGYQPGLTDERTSYGRKDPDYKLK